MKDLKGTKTEQNLQQAFAGESMARNKYTYFASKARKDGYEQIAAIFEETAHNEKGARQALVQTAPRRRNFRHHGQPPRSCRRRELRMDRHVFAHGRRGRGRGISPEIAFRFRAVAEIEKHHEETFTVACSKTLRRDWYSPAT